MASQPGTNGLKDVDDAWIRIAEETVIKWIFFIYFLLSIIFSDRHTSAMMNKLIGTDNSNNVEILKLTQFRKMRFPERSTGIGMLINQYLSCNKDLDDHVVHLLFSANRSSSMASN